MKTIDAAAGIEWWQTLFDPDWIKIFAYKNQETRKETNAIQKLLGLPPGSRILDLGCGNGRISIPLARKGYTVTGLDYSQSLLDEAAKKAARAKMEIDWIRRDMRDIKIANRYDAVINVFSSFGYFINEGDDLKMLQSVHKALTEDGKLIIDLENIFFIARAAQIYGKEVMYRPIEEHQGWVEEITDLDPVTQRVNMNLRLWLPKNKAVQSAKVSYRVYTFMEIKHLLEKAGFAIVNVYGNFDLTNYELDSERMIVLAIKNRHS